MHTKDQLAAALEAVGLRQMARVAAEGYYHDFLSPLALPEIQLVQDLADAYKLVEEPTRKQAIWDLRQRVMNGDFDASREESEAWAKSPEGQEAFSRLARGE